jgi:hypothetical protein
MGRDAGPIALNAFTNIAFLGGNWTTLVEQSPGLIQNFTIRGHVQDGSGRIEFAHVPQQSIQRTNLADMVQTFGSEQEHLALEGSPVISAGSNNYNAVQSSNTMNMPLRMNNADVSSECRAFVGYRIFRGRIDTPISSWERVADRIITHTWIDIEWGSQPQGAYRYAIVAVYSGENVSAPSLSNTLGRDWEGTLTLNLATSNGLSVVGAEITLVNNQDPRHAHFARARENMVEIPAIWFGNYTLTIELEGFSVYENKNLEIKNLFVNYATILTQRSVVWEEGFDETTFPKAGWLNIDQDGEKGTSTGAFYGWERVSGINFGGENPWSVSPHSGAGFVWSRSWDGVHLIADHWLITPKIPIDNDIEVLTLSYFARGNRSATVAGNIEILVSRTGTNIGVPVGTVTPVGVVGQSIGDFKVMSRTTVATEWTELLVDLTEFADAEHIHIAFRQRDFETDFIALDSVQLLSGAPATFGTITGIVTNIISGVPLANVAMSVEGSDTVVKTNQQGIFFIQADEGTIALNAELTGYLPFTQQVNVIAGQAVNVNVAMSPPAKISGVVRHKTTNALLGGVLVSIGEGQSMTTVGNGAFEFTGLVAGEYTITAMLAEFEPYASAVQVIVAGQALVYDILLDPVVGEGDFTDLPTITALQGNFPNPFNPVTQIRFDLAQAGNVAIEVYNIRGQRVKTLTNEEWQAGRHTIEWNGTDSNGRIVGSGVYFYTMRVGEYSSTRRMVLMK